MKLPRAAKITAGIVLVLLTLSVAAVIGFTSYRGPQLATLDAQLAEIARKYELDPVFPPMSQVNPLLVTLPAGETIVECWTADTVLHQSYRTVETLVASSRRAEVKHAAEFLRDIGLYFSAEGQKAESIRLHLSGWQLVEARKLRFEWQKEVCWDLLGANEIPVIGSVLRFDTIHTEVIGKGAASGQVDSARFRGPGAEVQSTGSWDYTESGRFKAVGDGMAVGIGKLRYALRQWRCPSVEQIALRPGEDFKPLGVCPAGTSSGTGPWYRLRLSKSRGRLVLEYQASGQDPVKRIEVTPGLEHSLAVLPRRTDRVLVEQDSAGYSAYVTRYELRPAEPTSSQVRTARALGAQDQPVLAQATTHSYHQLDALGSFALSFRGSTATHALQDARVELARMSDASYRHRPVAEWVPRTSRPVVPVIAGDTAPSRSDELSRIVLSFNIAASEDVLPTDEMVVALEEALPYPDEEASRPFEGWTSPGQRSTP